MKLTKQVTGRADKRTRGVLLLGGENGSGVAYSPDGELFETLQGEPPRAVTHGWGSLAFLYQRRRWR